MQKVFKEKNKIFQKGRVQLEWLEENSSSGNKEKEKVAAAVKRFIDFKVERWRFSLVLISEVRGMAICKTEEDKETDEDVTVISESEKHGGLTEILYAKNLAQNLA